MKPFNLLGLSILLVVLDGCVSNLQAGGSVDFEIIQSGVTPLSGVSGNRKVEFIHNQRSFTEALSSYSHVAAEQIDFAANQIVLLAAGEKPSGGYALRIDSVAEIEGALMLHATETYPGSNCMVTQALTAPYLFVKVLSVKRVATVVIRSEVVDCPGP